MRKVEGEGGRQETREDVPQLVQSSLGVVWVKK